jgi:hypothetical protein
MFSYALRDEHSLELSVSRKFLRSCLPHYLLRPNPISRLQRLQNSPNIGGIYSYPEGTFVHCSCQPSLDAHFPVLIR